MTPEERAENIMWIMGLHPERLYYTPSEKKADIAAQIREAEQEAQLKVLEQNEALVQVRLADRFKRGRASMREEAADLVEFKTDILETRHITAERIRAIDSKL